MSIRRGDIYYVRPGLTCGSEQRGGRPAVVVSNDQCNETSTVVEVVYLTTRDKTPLPTHAAVFSSGRSSLALCEQITSVSTSRVGDLVGHVTARELRDIDRALRVSLGIPDRESMTAEPGSPEEETVMVQVALRFVEEYIRRKSGPPEE